MYALFFFFERQYRILLIVGNIIAKGLQEHCPKQSARYSNKDTSNNKTVGTNSYEMLVRSVEGALTRNGATKVHTLKQSCIRASSQQQDFAAPETFHEKTAAEEAPLPLNIKPSATPVKTRNSENVPGITTEHAAFANPQVP